MKVRKGTKRETKTTRYEKKIYKRCRNKWSFLFIWRGYVYFQVNYPMSYSRFIQKNVVHWVQKHKLSNAHNFAIVHSIFTNRLSKCLIKNKNAIYSVQFYSPVLW